MPEAPPLAVAQRVAQVLGPSIWRQFFDAVGRGLAGAPGPGRVTSWYRNPARNVAAGGDPRSQHLLALAFDVDLFVADHRVDARARAIAQRLARAGFVVVPESDHIHAQAFPRGVLPDALYGFGF